MQAAFAITVQAVELHPWLWDLVRVGLFGAIGTFVGYRVALQTHIQEKRHDFLELQLREFYTPMLALRADIESFTERSYDLLNSNRFDEEFFIDQVWPKYQRLARSFSEKLWLASPSTRRFHREVVNVIQTFQVENDNNLIQGDNVDRFEKLKPFFEHLDRKFDDLQTKLIGGDD